MPDPVNTGEVSYGLVDDNPVRVNTAKIEAVPSETGRLGGYSEQYNSYSYMETSSNILSTLHYVIHYSHIIYI
jgi:hypothetical protein